MMRRKIIFAAIAAITFGLLVFDGVQMLARHRAAKLPTAAEQLPVQHVPD